MSLIFQAKTPTNKKELLKVLHDTVALTSVKLVDIKEELNPNKMLI
jgi:hypothetical protein